MVTTNKIYAASKAKFEEREMYELQLRRAIEAADGSGAEDDVSAEWYAWKSYLDWELALPKKKQDLTLICALFERSIMRYDYRGEAMWVWYLDVLVGISQLSNFLSWIEALVIVWAGVQWD